MGIQIGGLVSGFDTDSIVKELMAAERTKVDTAIQKRKQVEQQKEAYNKVSNLYSDFIINMRKEFGVSNSVSTTGLLRPSASSSLSWINKATSSNSNVTTKATSAAKQGSYDLIVKQKADNFKAASSDNVSINKDGTNIAESLGIDPNTVIDITVTNSKGESVSINQTADSLSLSDLATKLNSLDGVSVEYDKQIDRFFFKTTETGENNGITIQDNTQGGDGLLNALHLSSNETTITSGEYKGTDAIVNFNGADNLKFSSNIFSIQGIEINVATADTNEKISISVGTDVDAVVEKVTTFVDGYNKLIDNISSILAEQTYRDYLPLTDEQKESMTDKQIELWESKSNSGMLRNDPIIQKIQNSLRDSIMQPITLADGSQISLSDFGIEGKAYFDGGKNGALKIDEDKLRASIQNGADKLVTGLFGTPSDSKLNDADKNLSPSQIKEKFNQSGLFNRVSNVLIEGIGSIVVKAGLDNNESKIRQLSSFVLLDFTKSGSKSLLDNSITDHNKRIDILNTKLEKIEAQYWKKFSAMETALSNMQSQQSSLLSALGS